MADLRNYELGNWLGVNSTPTDRLTTTIARKHWPIDVGGNEFQGARAVEVIETEHLAKGSLYSIAGPRNTEQRNISGPLFPELAGTIIGCSGFHSDYQLASGLPQFFQTGRMFSGTLGVTASGHSSADIGEVFDGCVFGTHAVTFDREATAEPIRCTIGGYLNADRRIAAWSATSIGDHSTPGAISVDLVGPAVTTDLRVGEYVTIVDADNSTTETVLVTAITDSDTFTCTTTVALDGSGATALAIDKANENADLSLYPTLGPYTPTSVFADVEIGNAATGAYTAWTGDNSDVSSVSINADQALVVKTHTPSATDAPLDGSWTRVVDQAGTVTGSVTLILAQDDYLDWKRASTVRKIRMRLMGYHPQGDTTVLDGALTASSSNQSITVDSTADLTALDYIILDDGTNQAVVQVVSLDGTGATDLTITALDCDIDDDASVFNTAFEYKIHTADVISAELSRDDTNLTVEVNWEARITATQTTLMTTKSYDHVV